MPGWGSCRNEADHSISPEKWRNHYERTLLSHLFKYAWETERFPEPPDSGADPGAGQSEGAGEETGGESTRRLLINAEVELYNRSRGELLELIK